MRAVVRKQLENLLIWMLLGIGILLVTNFVGGLMAGALHVSNWFIGFPLFLILLIIVTRLLLKIDPERWR